jgi:hypothetical protein
MRESRPRGVWHFLAIGPPRFVPGGLSLGQLTSRRRFACGANQPIRLFQNVGIFRLFSRKKAEHHERRTK